MPEVSSTVPVCSVSELSEKSIRAVHVMVQAFVFVLFVFVSFFWFKLFKDNHGISDIFLFQGCGMKND